jgi:hypothetical protein
MDRHASQLVLLAIILTRISSVSNVQLDAKHAPLLVLVLLATLQGNTLYFIITGVKAPVLQQPIRVEHHVLTAVLTV